MDRRKLYYFRTPEDPRFSGLAIDCHMEQHNGKDYLCFNDTERGHMIEGTLEKEGETSFTLNSTRCDAGTWTFSVVTISIFRRWLYKYVDLGGAIAQKVNTTEDLHEWYRKRLEQGFD